MAPITYITYSYLYIYLKNADNMIISCGNSNISRKTFQSRVSKREKFKGNIINEIMFIKWRKRWSGSNRGSRPHKSMPDVRKIWVMNMLQLNNEMAQIKPELGTSHIFQSKYKFWDKDKYCWDKRKGTSTSLNQLSQDIYALVHKQNADFL